MQRKTDCSCGSRLPIPPKHEWYLEFRIQDSGEGFEGGSQKLVLPCFSSKAPVPPEALRQGPSTRAKRLAPVVQGQEDHQGVQQYEGREEVTSEFGRAAPRLVQSDSS